MADIINHHSSYLKVDASKFVWFINFFCHQRKSDVFDKEEQNEYGTRCK